MCIYLLISSRVFSSAAQRKQTKNDRTKWLPHICYVKSIHNQLSILKYLFEQTIKQKPAKAIRNHQSKFEQEREIRYFYF